MKKLVIFLIFFIYSLPVYANDFDTIITSTGSRYVSINDDILSTPGMVLLDIRDYLMYIAILLTCGFIRNTLTMLLGKKF